MKGPLTILFSFLLSVLSAGCKEQQTAPPIPPEVSVITAQPQDANIYKTYVGQTFGKRDITIPARVEGFITGIHFKEGSTVKKGALLYTIDDQPFKANVAAKMGKLAEAQTALVKAESDLNRIRPLAETHAVSQSDLDSAVAAFDAAKASVTAAEANLQAAKIEMSYTRIKAPITGVIGKTTAKVGDFVGRSANNSALNMISDISTILVRFFLSEQEYLAFSKSYGKQHEKDDAKKTLPRDIELILADGSVHLHKGKIDFVDRGVDPTTGTILLQASFPNPDRRLRPGLYARVKILVAVKKQTILIPQRSVKELQELKQVFVVTPENKVNMRLIKTEGIVDNKWIVSEGVKPGEKVIVEGLQMVKDGMIVSTKQYVQQEEVEQNKQTDKKSE